MQVRNLLLILSFCLFAGSAFGQTTEFTYQGSLRDGAVAANKNYDFEFLLYGAVAGGAQIGSTTARTNVAVANGIFAVKLDFGVNFPGADRYLEIRVKNSGSGGFTILDPRQRLGSSPYAIKSLSAENATQLNGVAASQYVQTTDPRLTDARPPTPGSGDYIQNTASPQMASNFNISGSGIAAGTLSGNIVNSATQYNLAGAPFLRAGPGSTYAGLNVATNSTGAFNSFFGHSSANANTTGSSNSFFGVETGFSLTFGESNTFMGDQAGFSNASGNHNSYFGRATGSSNSASSNNSLFGSGAGFFNSGGGNSFFGRSSGDANTTGSNNTAIGSQANVGSNNLVFATAIGAGAIVTTNNRIQIGRAGIDTVRIGGLIGGASAIHVCLADFVLSTCSSSGRYKEDIQPLADGLDVVRLFRPVAFKWKNGGDPDIGLIAEEVAEIEPLLVTRSQNSEIEGVKYDIISVLLINAVKEQQAQIEKQQTQMDEQNRVIKEQRALIDGLKKLVCQTNPDDDACKR